MKLNKMTLGASDIADIKQSIVDRVSGGQQLMASYGVDAPAAKQSNNHNYKP